MFYSPASKLDRTIFHQLNDVLLRILAVVMMVVSIGAWMRLVGWQDAPNWRFDLMSNQSWGVVIWLGLALAQFVVFGFLDARLEYPFLVLGIQIIGVFAFAALRWQIMRVEHH